MRNPFKKKENNNNTPFQGIASFFLRLFYLINRMGEYIANYFLTIENQEKITEIGQFRGFKRSFILLNILIVTVITLFLWSFFAKTDQVVRADGTVIPASKIQLVQSSYGGVVDKILVNLSDDVRAGDIIFEIDKDQSLINYETAKEEVTSRERKVKIFEKLLASGSEAEMTIINEKLLLAEAKRRYIEAEKRYNSNQVKSPVDGKISTVNVATIGQVVGTGELLDALVHQLPPEKDEPEEKLPRLAVVGRPNVGKSTLVNTLLGEDRNIVTDIAGTTRDSVHARYNMFGFDNPACSEI